jgi:hypothetical protein
MAEGKRTTQIENNENTDTSTVNSQKKRELDKGREQRGNTDGGDEYRNAAEDMGGSREDIRFRKE